MTSKSTGRYKDDKTDQRLGSLAPSVLSGRCLHAVVAAVVGEWPAIATAGEGLAVSPQALLS